MFSVKSAYKLALNLKDCSEETGISSSAVNKERRMWDVIWKAKVPQKIRNFAWRAATNSLAVQVNRVNHHQTVLGLCTICGVQDESIVHALVTCPKVRAMRIALGEVWNIPGEELFKFRGPDWLLILLDQLGLLVREQVLFMLWRAWHLRNDLIIGKGKESVSASVIFVKNYWK